MSIKHAILGFLSWKPMSGYDLKKLFADSDILYWSGNNNQIYRALVDLHKQELVTKNVEYQEKNPARKVYTITAKGQEALREWILSPPGLPELRHQFLVQLAWADQLEAEELDDLLARYEDEVHVKLMMLREQAQRSNVAPNRTVRETLVWDLISDNLLVFYEQQLSWVRNLRKQLRTMYEQR
jgi:DNA-binding PadR family transcriptional regulator